MMSAGRERGTAKAGRKKKSSAHIPVQLFKCQCLAVTSINNGWLGAFSSRVELYTAVQQRTGVPWAF